MKIFPRMNVRFLFYIGPEPCTSRMRIFFPIWTPLKSVFRKSPPFPGGRGMAARFREWDLAAKFNLIAPNVICVIHSVTMVTL
jgi:hypothetical protein